jgi:hypothetical protein
VAAAEDEEAAAAAYSPVSAADATAEAAEVATLEFQTELAFAVIDKDGDGKLSREDLKWAVVAMRRIRGVDLGEGSDTGLPAATAALPVDARADGTSIEAPGEPSRAGKEDAGEGDDDDASPAEAMAAAAAAHVKAAAVASDEDVPQEGEESGPGEAPMLLRAVSAVEVSSEIDRLFDAAALLLDEPRDLGAAHGAGGDEEGGQEEEEDGTRYAENGEREVISLSRFKRLVASDVGARELLQPAMRTLREGVGVV